MPLCQTCLGLGFPSSTNIKRIKLSLSYIQDSVNNGCEGCALLWNAMHLFKRDLELSQMTYVWCSPPHLVYSNPGNKHFRIDFEKISSSTSDSIELFKPTGSVFNHQSRPLLLPGPELFGTSRDSSLVELQRMMQACLKHHYECPPHAISRLPTRVIDVGDGRPPRSIKLHISTGEMDNYICLSHCWGNQQPFRTLLGTIEGYKTAIHYESLPRTFQDAVRVTRSLGIRYLWIDAVCIIQDSESDWAAEASQMADIYQNSYLTISAAWSLSSLGGCFNDEDAPVYFTKTISHVGDDGSKENVHVRKTIRHDFNSDPLYSRGWVFQEWLISPRIVHFNSQEMLFECSSKITCQCRHNGWSFQQKENFKRDIRSLAYSQDFDREYWVPRWHTVVQEYTQRHLTFGKDKLPAFSGLARLLQPHGSTKYIAGLWEQTLLDDLVWVVLKPVEKQRPIPWRAPTWSWAATDSPVAWHYGDFLDPHPDVMIINVSAMPKSQDQFGEVLSAELEILGPLLKIGASIIAGNPRGDRGIPCISLGGYDLDLEADYDWYNTNNLKTVGERIWCLPLGRQVRSVSPHVHIKASRDIALVLLHNPDDETFERIGIICHIHRQYYPHLDWSKAPGYQGRRVLKIV